MLSRILFAIYISHLPAGFSLARFLVMVFIWNRTHCLHYQTNQMNRLALYPLSYWIVLHVFVDSPSRSVVSNSTSRVESDHSDRQMQSIAVGLPTSTHLVSSAEKMENKKTTSELFGVSSGLAQARAKTHVSLLLIEIHNICFYILSRLWLTRVSE